MNHREKSSSTSGARAQRNKSLIEARRCLTAACTRATLLARLRREPSRAKELVAFSFLLTKSVI